MPTFATAAELASLMQQDVDTSSAELVLDLVEVDLLDAANVADVASLPTTAKGVGLRAAVRLYANPAGLTSEAIDDYRRNFGNSYLTTQERDILVSPPGASGAFSIRAYGEPYVAQAGGNPLCGWGVDE